MPVTTIPVVSGGQSYAQWTAIGEAKPTAVQADNGDGSYVVHTADATTKRETYPMDRAPEFANIIDSISCKPYVRETIAEGLNRVFAIIRYNGVDVESAKSAPGTNYVDIVHSIAESPGGGAWTLAKWGATECGIGSDAAGAGNEDRCTYLRAEMTWRTGPTGFVHLITSWLGPLVAVGLDEMPRLAGELLRRSGTRIRPEELLAAWRSLRAPRRVYLVG